MFEIKLGGQGELASLVKLKSVPTAYAYIQLVHGAAENTQLVKDWILSTFDQTIGQEKFVFLMNSP